jgi:hypothetical protein
MKYASSLSVTADATREDLTNCSRCGATVVWSRDDWATANRLDTAREGRLNPWFADFPTAGLAINSVIKFTFFWKRDQRWQGENFQMSDL